MKLKSRQARPIQWKTKPNNDNVYAATYLDDLNDIHYCWINLNILNTNGISRIWNMVMFGCDFFCNIKKK